MKAIVEMPSGCKYKYEAQEDGKQLALDRPLKIPVPWNYGFIPETLCEDGDAIDVFIASTEPIPPLTLVELDIVGVLICEDNGEQDDKLLAYVKHDQDAKTSINKNRFVYEIKFYLSTYKTGFKIKKEMDKIEAKKRIKKAISAFKKQKN